ncbi:hypothetical protein [Runella slithyformis]|uniref:Uncharacterized protein n=1 Tax=Runella slithyformis (strain ATCC 29530 / DSM 19594 / LMG 11500 / NCIMB 11436 / LSU 4) TaxID=761193 RepID=A0A7U3ZQ62_RUNSL|nr:hypothetical protein [Runella slithyformis]AEI51327.1 hypothetical protein Runsl_5018 [Runella slithyformis DSM 19594]
MIYPSNADGSLSDIIKKKTEEILRLSKENSSLKNKINRMSKATVIMGLEKELQKKDAEIARKTVEIKAKMWRIDYLNEELERAMRSIDSLIKKNAKIERDKNKEIERIIKEKAELEKRSISSGIDLFKKSEIEESNKRLTKENSKLKERLFELLRDREKIVHDKVYKNIEESGKLKNENDKYHGGEMSDGSIGFYSERRENGRFGSLSSFDNYDE